MPMYRYKARDRAGLSIKGELEVANEDILADKLENMGYLLISAEEFDPTSGGFGADFFEKYRKVKLKLLVEFSVQLATLINAGLPLLSAIEALSDQAEDPLFKRIVGTVRRDISVGKSFSEALAEHPQAFSDFYVNMIRAGEAAGQLDNILITLSSFLEKDQSIKQKVKSAMMYPIAMLVISIAVVTFLVTVVLPSFVTIFKSSGIKLPLPTQLVMGFSAFVIKDWYLIVIGAIVSFVLLRMYTKTEKGRYYFDRFKFSIPVFGNLLKKTSISRFARTFGTLIESGVPILSALDIVKRTVGNVVISIVVENIREHISEGGAVAEQIELSGVFPKMVSKMITVGENSGTLDKMLLKVSDFYDSEVENDVKGLTSILEPIMIVGMGGVIGVIVLSVMLPMFDMMQVAKK